MACAFPPARANLNTHTVARSRADARACGPLGRYSCDAMGRVEKYPTAAQSEGFGARGRERTGHATGGLGHGALGHRVEAAGQGGGGAKNSGHLRVVARTEVLSAGRAIEFCYTVLRASTGFGLT